MLWAVVMAGGSGTRFWPESRRKNPKQFLHIFGKKSLLVQTVDRIEHLIPASRILVITQQDKVLTARKLLKRVPSDQIIGEPVGRNTAPCAILAAALAAQKDPQAVIALLPADHHIQKPHVFRRALQSAAAVAHRTGAPVTFGIKPDYPHTGYGYLEMDRRIRSSKGFSVFQLKRFHEKPTLLKAKEFLKSKKYLWNSGMFVWKAESLLLASKKCLPSAHQIIFKIISGPLGKGMDRYYSQMPNISIDYGLMEKMKGSILTIPADFGWNDVGGWKSLEGLWPQDKHGNTSLGQSLLIESRGNIIKSGKRLVVLLGVKDHVVVDTPDAVLICPKEQTESIRKVVASLQAKPLKKYL